MQWSPMRELRVPRMGLRMAAAGNCLYAMGGMTYDETRHAQKGSSSPITDSVEMLCPGEEGDGDDGTGDEL